jgi:hypothetical protein
VEFGTRGGGNGQKEKDQDADGEERATDAEEEGRHIGDSLFEGRAPGASASWEG